MIFKLCGIGLIAAVLCSLLKRTGAETVPLALIAAVTVILLSADTLHQIVKTVSDTLSPVGFGEYGTVAVKALGIALTVKLTSDVCRRCGEDALSGGIEFVGKLEMLSLCLPLLTAVLDAVRELIS